MSERGTGRTTRQLMALPLRSLFVVEHYRDREYVERLLRHLGRRDIRVITPQRGFEETRGMEWAAVEVDHDCQLSDRERYMLNAIVMPFVRLKPEPFVSPSPTEGYWGVIFDVGSGP